MSESHNLYSVQLEIQVFIRQPLLAAITDITANDFIYKKFTILVLFRHTLEEPFVLSFKGLPQNSEKIVR